MKRVLFMCVGPKTGTDIFSQIEKQPGPFKN